MFSSALKGFISVFFFHPFSPQFWQWSRSGLPGIFIIRFNSQIFEIKKTVLQFISSLRLFGEHSRLQKKPSDPPKTSSISKHVFMYVLERSFCSHCIRIRILNLYPEIPINWILIQCDSALVTLRSPSGIHSPFIHARDTGNNLCYPTRLHDTLDWTCNTSLGSCNVFNFIFYLELLLEKDRSNAPANTEHIEKLKVSFCSFKFVCLTKVTLFEHRVVLLLFWKKKNILNVHLLCFVNSTVGLNS